MDHVSDHPWPGWSIEFAGMHITLMSSAIASMILIALLLGVLIPLRARKAKLGHSTGVLEVVVLFVRDNIARPALGDKAENFLPLLLTMLTFVLGMNLIGLLPLQAISHLIPGNHYTIGATPTGVLTVCGALGAITLFTILSLGFYQAAKTKANHSRVPFAICILISPILWFLSLAPTIPGLTGKLLLVPLAILEAIGAIAKCFALMIRIFANMMAGHFLLAVMMMFIVQRLTATVASISDSSTPNDISSFYIGPICIIASVFVDLMEILVAGLQAYIYTFLSAMFIGLYVEASH